MPAKQPAWIHRWASCIVIDRDVPAWLSLVEEFRPFLADRMVLSLINRQQIQPKDFTLRESGAVYLNESGRKTFLTGWQQRKQETITHPFLNEKTTVGLLMHLQARLMARYLRGDLDVYPPFIWK